MIDLRPEQLALVRRLLAAHVPECEVRAFGSRTKGTAKPYSDLDLMVMGKAKLERSRLNRLEEAFEESTLPFRVEVMDGWTLSVPFREAIAGEAVQVWPPIEKNLTTEARRHRDEVA